MLYADSFVWLCDTHIVNGIVGRVGLLPLMVFVCSKNLVEVVVGAFAFSFSYCPTILVFTDLVFIVVDLCSSSNICI